MKTKPKARKGAGANASGGAIEKGQSRSAHAKTASTGKTGKAEWLDETERDTPDRKKITDELTNASAKPRTARKR
jgi:hypothetical protein